MILLIIHHQVFFCDRTEELFVLDQQSFSLLPEIILGQTKLKALLTLIIVLDLALVLVLLNLVKVLAHLLVVLLLLRVVPQAISRTVWVALHQDDFLAGHFVESLQLLIKHLLQLFFHTVLVDVELRLQLDQCRAVLEVVLEDVAKLLSHRADVAPFDLSGVVVDQ